MLWLTALIAFLASLSVNALADRFLVERIPVLGSFAGLLVVHNPGVAFGMQFPSLVQSALIAAALVAVLWVAVRSKRTIISSIGFGLIIGGALANIVDRLQDGIVTDYFQAGTFPVFNLADSCITVGAAVLIVEAIVRKK